jgi:hypothetical protein
MRGGAVEIAQVEPGGGSDLQALRTTAIRDGDHYVLNASKTFISNGASAGLIVLVVKTEPSAGAKGTSLVDVETADAEGFRVGRILNKLGMKTQDTNPPSRIRGPARPECPTRLYRRMGTPRPPTTPALDDDRSADPGAGRTDNDQ